MIRAARYWDRDHRVETGHTDSFGPNRCVREPRAAHLLRDPLRGKCANMNTEKFDPESEMRIKFSLCFCCYKVFLWVRNVGVSVPGMRAGA